MKKLTSLALVAQLLLLGLPALAQTMPTEIGTRYIDRGGLGAPCSAGQACTWRNGNVFNFHTATNTNISLTGVATTLTTKGDLLGYSTGLARLGVGSDGQMLAADSTQALGIKWAAPPTLQQAYTNGAAGSYQAIVLDATRKAITIQDAAPQASGWIFGVHNGGSSVNYFSVVNGTQAGASASGIMVYNSINGWNGNTLYIGNSNFGTAAVSLGSNTYGIDVTVDRNLTVNNNLTISGLANFTGGQSFTGATFSATPVGAFTIVGGAPSTLNTLGGNVYAAVFDRSSAGPITLGATTATSVGIGHSGVTTTITGGLTQLTGAFSFTGNGASQISTSSGALPITAAAASTWDSGGGTVKAATVTTSASGTLTLGDANGTTIAVSPSGTNRWNYVTTALTPAADNAETIGSATLRVATIQALAMSSGTSAAAVDTAGSNITISAQSAGSVSAANGKVGAAITFSPPVGVAGVGGFAGGNAGAISLNSANGGAGTASAAAGNGSSISFATGSGGTSNGGGGGAAGNFNINIGLATGAASSGGVNFQSNGVNELAISPSSIAFYPLASGTGILGLSASANYFAGVFSRHFSGGGTAPTIAVGNAAQLGTGPAAVVTVGTDAAGTVTFTSGTTPSVFVGGTEVKIGTLTFNIAYTTTAPRAISVFPAGATSAALASGTVGVNCYGKQATTAVATFDIFCVDSGAGAFAGSTPYPYGYIAIQ